MAGRPVYTRLVHLILMALLVPLPAVAQPIVQWTWDGELALGRDSYSRITNGTEISTIEQSELELLFGVDGFILDPRIVPFRLAVNAVVVDYSGQSARLDSDSFGVEARLKLFPYKRYSAEVIYHRGEYGFEDGPLEQGPLYGGLPKWSSFWSVRMPRVQEGRLKGVSLGAQRTEFAFLEATRGGRVSDQQFVDWATSTKRFRNHTRLEHRSSDLAGFAIQLEDTTLTFSQTGDWRPGLKWNFSGYGIRRTSSVEDRPGYTSDSMRVLASLDHPGEHHHWHLDYSGGITRTDDRDPFQSQRVLFRYVLRPRSHWQVAPYASFGYQTSHDRSTQAPSLGTVVSFNPRLRRIQLALSASGSYGSTTTRYSVTGESEESENVGYSFQGSLGYGNARAVRAFLEFMVATNELTRAGEVIEPLPDLGAGLATYGLQDQGRARLTLAKSTRRFSLSLFGDWDETRIDSDDPLAARNITRLTYNLQFSGPRFSFTAQSGDLEVERATTPTEARFQSARLTLSPLRFLRLQAFYRLEQRNLVLDPTQERERFDVRVDLRIAKLTFSARFFRIDEQALGFPDTTNEGLELTLRRRFEGRLPIFSSLRRRGVIR